MNSNNIGWMIQTIFLFQSCNYYSCNFFLLQLPRPPMAPLISMLSKLSAAHIILITLFFRHLECTPYPPHSAAPTSFPPSCSYYCQQLDFFRYLTMLYLFINKFKIRLFVILYWYFFLKNSSLSLLFFLFIIKTINY